ncbi:MAG: hypothetical protein HY714_03790 [Candidatus Omnitrophica bacterium]|nr:hypothetical protein [Candidatus Omnitrophota bacterium]
MTVKKRALSFFAASFLLFVPLSPAQISGGSAVIQALNRNLQAFHGIRAYLELELSQPGNPINRSQGQLAMRADGDLFYFKTFSPLTPHYFTLVSKKRTFWLQIPKLKTVYTGPLEAIGRDQFEMKVTPQDFKMMILPEAVDQTPDQIQAAEQADRWVVTLNRVSGTGQYKERELVVLKDGLRVLKDTRFSLDGKPYLEIQWNRFEPVENGSLFPLDITLFKPMTGYLLRLKIRKAALSGRVPEELFDLGDPASYRKETISG